MTDESKAIQEVAKTAGKAVDAGRELGGFLSKYLGGSIKQAMGIVEDKLKYQRWERKIRLIDRANHFLAKRGLPKPSRIVPLQIAIPLIQGGSLEEDNGLQDRWATLLVNAADATSHIHVRRAFISILEDLTPFDAVLLQKIYSSSVDPSDEKGLWTIHLPDYVSEEGPGPNENGLRPPNHVEVSLGNLARLGLITSAMFYGGIALFNCINRTVLGREFMKAITLDDDDA